MNKKKEPLGGEFAGLFLTVGGWTMDAGQKV